MTIELSILETSYISKASEYDQETNVIIYCVKFIREMVKTWFDVSIIQMRFLINLILFFLAFSFITYTFSTLSQSNQSKANCI